MVAKELFHTTEHPLILDTLFVHIAEIGENIPDPLERPDWTPLYI